MTMHNPGEIESINIRPGVAILSVLQHLNYKPWFAMAEFVDNSLQSYLDYKDQLLRFEERMSGFVSRLRSIRRMEGASQ